MHVKKFSTLFVMTTTIMVLQLARPSAAEPEKGAGDSVSLTVQKVEESEAKTRLEEPNFGYVGNIGTFAATTKNSAGAEAHANFVVHSYPRQDKLSLGCTKLKYEGAKRLGNVDGWIFTTEWDGKAYPSKVFVSAHKVYFGGGEQAYIAADFRTDTGWAWKMVPLRRMELTSKANQGAGTR